MGSLASLDCPTGSIMEPRSFSPVFRVCMYVCQLNRVVCVVLMLYTKHLLWFGDQYDFSGKGA